MARHWAIAIGINQYQSLPSLQYAKRDARLIRDFLARNAKFEQVYYFSDDASDIVLDGVTFSAQPTFANLYRFLELRFSSPFLNPDDTLWFFFSGHGLQYANWDYLMPCDANPDQAETTALSIDYVVERLRRSGSANIVLFLDACRTEEQKFGQGFGTDPKEVTTLFSSDFNQISHEIEALKQSPFSYALLEALRLQNKQPGATIEHLYEYLRDRVPELSIQYGKPQQIPRLSAHSLLTVNSAPILHDSPSQPFASLIPGNSVKPTGGRLTNPLTVAQDRRARKRLLIKLAGMGLVIAGTLAYVAYQESIQKPPTVASSSLSAAELAQQATSPSSHPDNGTKTNGRQPATNKPTRAATRQFTALDLSSGQDGYKRIPKTGIYYAVSPQFSTSRREIGSSSGRFCIQIVDGPTAQAPGNQQITVSSLSLRQDGAYVDATQEKLTIDPVYAEFTDSKSVWQLLEDKVDRTGLMAECLTSQSRYVRQIQGDKAQNSQ